MIAAALPDDGTASRNTPVSNLKSWQSIDLSRRNLLRGAFVAVGGGVLAGASMAASTSQAANKMPQKAVNYQATPKGKAQCDNCAQWQAPASCKIVQGVISPSGWCTVYAPKPR